MSDKIYLAKQINALLKLAGQYLNISDSEKMQIADIYPVWAANREYAAGAILKYGQNADGETQLFSVLLPHVSQDDWPPEATPSLYKKIGFTDSGTPIWTQPLGAADAYMKGDTVSFGGKLWVSDADGNVWQPGVYGWTEAD